MILAIWLDEYVVWFPSAFHGSSMSHKLPPSGAPSGENAAERTWAAEFWRVCLDGRTGETPKWQLTIPTCKGLPTSVMMLRLEMKSPCPMAKWHDAKGDRIAHSMAFVRNCQQPHIFSSSNLAKNRSFTTCVCPQKWQDDPQQQLSKMLMFRISS